MLQIAHIKVSSSLVDNCNSCCCFVFQYETSCGFVTRGVLTSHMMAVFKAGTAASCTSEVELTLCCRSLQTRDLLSKSDPMCVVFTKPFAENRWLEHHRTEVISNNNDPDFTKKVHMVYHFEQQQPLKIEVYDVDSDSTNLADHDFLGASVCNLAQIIGSGKVKLPLTGGGKESYVVIIAEELATLKDEIVLQFSGHNLDKKNFFWKSDPFLVFEKSMESGEYCIVHKTEVIKSTTNPSWKRFHIPVRTLCNGDYDRNLKVTCYDWNSSGHYSLIGEFYVTLKEMLKGPCTDTKFQCIHPQKKKKTSYVNSGEIHLEYLEIRKLHSFMDFIKGGTQLHCSIAIDFTASNGNPESSQSLHYISPLRNMYEQAIEAVGNIIQDYDSDKMFPVLGFGARLPPDGRISHEFFVNMDPSNPYCQGIAGVLDAYRRCVHQLQLYGPTNFSPVINHVARFASSNCDGSNYFILLILTDGVITDMAQTVQAIVAASALPLSIIIVGIGNADFTAMETLDADSIGLSLGGRKAVRDIVQFVPFNKFINSADVTTARLQLAREVLAEVPQQLVTFMQMNNIPPQPPKQNVVFLPVDPEQHMQFC